MRFTTITITAITRRIWINPPNVYEEINPTNHKTTRIIATVHNMLITLPLFTQFSVVFPIAGSFSFQASLKQTNSRRLIHQVNYCFNRLHYTSTSFHLQMLAYYMVKSASVVQIVPLSIPEEPLNRRFCPIPPVHPFPHDQSQIIRLSHKVIFSTHIPLTILKHYLINHYSSEI